jgi:hypothetical protein
MPMPGVTVALPVHRDPGTLAQALACITAQTLSDLDILVILNGADRATRESAHALIRSDRRVRLIELPEANLAAACNTALEAARFELVARMDADDLCRPTRLARQAIAMIERPALSAIGSAWEILGESDQVITTVRPPTDPAAMRWRLLLGNTLAHGSVMLRREHVLKAGGYNTRCDRAQDYELWLRLSQAGEIGACPEVLYQHRTRFSEDPGRSDAQQAAIAGPAMLGAWQALPAADIAIADRLRTALTAAMARENGADMSQLEAVLSAAPTREALLAWLWAQWHHPPAPRRAAEISKRARLREIGIQLRARSIGAIWLWGAGDHTRWVLENRDELGVEILGIVDDHLAGARRFEFAIQAPAILTPRDCALLSSDWHEDALWASSKSARARGVIIIRLYGVDQ